MIHKAIKQLQIDEPIILVGHSWSGTMTLSYALQFPDDVAGIITLGGAMYKEGYPAENGDPLSKLIMTPFIGNFLLHTLLKSPLGKSMGKATTRETFAPEEPPPSYEEKLLTIWLRPLQFKSNREDILAFPKTSKQLSSHYKNIKTPTMIVVGENDPFGTIEMAKRLNKDLPNSDLVMLPNVAHMIPENHPEEVINVLQHFHKIIQKQSTYSK